MAPAPAPVTATGQSTGIAWPISGGEWEVVQGYNNGTHTNRSGFAQYKYSLDWARVDGNTAGQPVFAPVSGTIKWVDRGSGGMLVDAGNGYGVAVFHVTIDRGLTRGGSVERGQQIGTISGPGGEGYMSMPHIDITVWQLNGRGHEAVPFTGPNAIGGQEFPDNGGANQHMGATVTP
jgi:murein DD-endopeptidase MepM/ murein hydrolase activator NlpD